MATISDKRLNYIKKLYYKDSLSMKEIGKHLGISWGAVNYFMKKHNLKRRDLKTTSQYWFENKKSSFKVLTHPSIKEKELMAVGAMLYWGEGYKTQKSQGVDFANSDPEMVIVFVNFLRTIYRIDESRLRAYLYCYLNQNPRQLMLFWSKVTNISLNQFTEPYIRKEFLENGRKMKYGLIHIRYSDKKLLWSILDLVELYKEKFK